MLMKNLLLLLAAWSALARAGITPEALDRLSRDVQRHVVE